MIPDLIYDVGMNNGDDTAYYLHRGYRVVSIEADPSLVVQATERFARPIADGRLTILNVAIAEEAGELPFWICEANSTYSSLDRSAAVWDRTSTAQESLPHHSVQVRSSRLDTILQEHGVPFYLKIDIEGHDHVCIEQLDPAGAPRYVSVEACGTAALERLRDAGYTHFKCISQHVFLPVELPPPPAQERYQALARLLHDRNPLLRAVRRIGGWRPIYQRMEQIRVGSRTIGGWTFSGCSSGPFGEDLPGRWLSFEEMNDTYQHYAHLEAERGPSLFWNEKPGSFWADFHARRDDRH
jgi:FkbM family methyltransferase